MYRKINVLFMSLCLSLLLTANVNAQETFAKDSLFISNLPTMIALSQTVFSNEILSDHTCGMGPHKLDIFNNSQYFKSNGKIISRVDYYYCGDKPNTCLYMRAITYLY